MSGRALLWIAAAVLGIVASAAVAWSASQLAGQRIGLGSEPLSVVSGLAPQAPRAQAPPHQRHSKPKVARAHSHPATAGPGQLPAVPPASPLPRTTGAVTAPAAPAPAPSLPTGSATPKSHDDSRAGGSRDTSAGPDD